MKSTFKPEYTRYLPHFIKPGKTFFVTFRLHGSLPKEFLDKTHKIFAEAKSKIEMMNPPDLEHRLSALQRDYFYAYDKALDACTHGPTYLKDPKIAQITAEQFHRFDGIYYKLIGYTIIPNHVHSILDFSVQLDKYGGFDREKYKNLDYVMDRIKGASARYSNLALDRTGEPYWQNGWHDRYIRDARHLTGAINYLKQNSVAANLCTHWTEHPFTYIHEDYAAR